MASSSATKVMPDYESSQTFRQRIKQFSISYGIKPQWMGKSSCFWYRREERPDQYSFFYVDAEQSLRRPVFNHEKLASALKRRDIAVGDHGLPIQWIDVAANHKSIKFRTTDDQKWCFDDDDDDGTLTPYDGDIDQPELKPMPQEKPSTTGSNETHITFRNETTELISYVWIDYDGNTKTYGTIPSKRFATQKTYANHVWRVVNTETDEPIASFMAEASPRTAIIDENTKNCTKFITDKPDPKSRSTDGGEEKARPRRRVFVKDYNVWLRGDGDDGKDTQLSTTGTKDNPFDDHVYKCANGTHAVVYQYTPEQEHLVYHIQSSPQHQLQPKLRKFQYLKPGDKVRVDRPRLFDVQKQQEVDTDDALFRNPYWIKDAGWNRSNTEYMFLYNERGHQTLRLLAMDTCGNVRVVIEETSKTFIDYSNKYYDYSIEDKDEIIWMSERDGWNHLYLFDQLTGQLKRQLTQGEWVVRSVEHVDEAKRQLWFSALGMVEGQDPYYAHLVRINLDGTGLIVLTAGDGSHSWTWSPDREYLIDTWSRVNQAPTCVVRRSDTGQEIVPLERWSLDGLLEAGWTVPTRYSAPGRDRHTLIYGIIVQPRNLDPATKYPIIEIIYAGPHKFSVPNTFGLLTRAHELADLGFVVVMIDGMGTNWRSKAFHDRCYKNIHDAGFPDRIAWLEAAASSRAWMDVERVGICGGSAGGHNAMAALLWYGHVYQAGVADSGCHDLRMDKLWWPEQWMGWPVDQSYEDSSNVVHAARLTGALMLIVGELDDNVDPATTMQVVHALHQAKKDYELVYVVGGGHCPGSSGDYVLRRQSDFFIKHLMGAWPKNRNAAAAAVA